MVDVVEPDQSYDDEVDGNDVVQQRGHYQNQNAGDNGDERRDVGGSESHFKSPRVVGISINSGFRTSPRAGPGSPGITVCHRAASALAGINRAARGNDREEQVMTRAFLRCTVVLVLAMAAAIAPATAQLPPPPPTFAPPANAPPRAGTPKKKPPPPGPNIAGNWSGQLAQLDQTATLYNNRMKRRWLVTAARVSTWTSPQQVD